MKFSSPFVFVITALLVASCSFAPKYHKPEIPLPQSFKENADWKLATPLDVAPRGEWWQVYCDSTLNDLQAQLIINNQTIKAAEAALRQSEAALSAARASFFPSIGVTSSIERRQTSALAKPDNAYSANGTVSWEADLWGRVRNSVASQQAVVAASEADLAAATLSAQAALATFYFDLRIADEQKRYLAETVEAYQKSLSMTEELYKNGLQTRSDFLQAKVQLESAQAQLVNVDIQRTAYEHAIAVLIGKAPSDFSLQAVTTLPAAPLPPEAIPSQMLQRRPDIAAAERRAASANAEIGVARAAFFPDLTLSASGGYSSNSLAKWFTMPNRLWSIGPDVALAVFDAGLRKSQTEQAIAAYDGAVANYRQTVLAAFQDVEDQLSAITTLNKEQEIRNSTVEDAQASTQLITSQYKEGITSYFNVVTAQTTELNNALSALAVRKSRLDASVALIKALGGGWTVK